jgi:hypothetical protein
MLRDDPTLNPPSDERVLRNLGFRYESLDDEGEQPGRATRHAETRRTDAVRYTV